MTPKTADIPRLIRLLESDDTKVADDTRQALVLQMELGNGIKQIVTHFADHGSERALELLCHNIKDQYVGDLLNTLKEMMQTRTSAAIILLGQIVQSAPSWVPQIARHDIFLTVLRFINRTHTHVKSEDIAALLFLSGILPHCCGLSDHMLRQLFDTFLNACSFLSGKLRDIRSNTSEVDKINITHLQYAVREYFHSLYGIYPFCMVHHLRGHFKDTTSINNQRIFEEIIMPLLNGVKFHPNLILMDKEKELSKERWSQREAHDFLDDCRKVVIGLIPLVPTGVEREEEEEVHEDIVDVVSQFCPKDSDDVNIPYPINSMDQSQDTGIDEEMDLMSHLNTPPGTRSSSPHPLMPSNVVLPDEKQRRKSVNISEDKRSRSFLGSILGFRKKNSTPQVPETVYEPLIEVLPAEEDLLRRNSDPILPEEAEEANANSESGSSVTTPQTGTPNNEVVEEEEVVTEQPLEETIVCENDETSIDFSNGVFDQSTPKSHRRPSSTNPIFPSFDDPDFEERQDRSTRRSDPMRAHMYDIEKAREAARQSIRERGHTTELGFNFNMGDLCRSRTSSFRNTKSPPIPELSEMFNFNGTEGTSECDHDSLDDVHNRSRFSVTSFFKKLNRQRFHSECPPAFEASSNQNAVLLHRPELSRRFLARTTSCPMAIDTLIRAEPGEIMAQTNQVPLPTGKALWQHFPYLELLNGPNSVFYANLERELERDHEVRRENYMDASSDFHQCLKRLCLADRLPGRIYDDMSQITKNLPLNQQVDILRTRLQLVNQHLLYERSCRLLHANRNRRLFGRIKQQKNIEAEIIALKEADHELRKERDNLITALSQMRRKERKTRDEVVHREIQFSKKMKKMHETVAELEYIIGGLRMRIVQLDEWLNDHSIPFCLGWRKAADAEVCAKLTQDELDAAQELLCGYRKVMKENQSLRDSLELLERHRKEDEREFDADSERRRSETVHAIQSQFDVVKHEKDMFEVMAISMEEDLEKERKVTDELRDALKKAEKVLLEQAEAAEQKFISLQAFTSQLEHHVSEVYKRYERVCPGEDVWSESDPELDFNIPGITADFTTSESQSMESALGGDYFIRAVSSEILPNPQPIPFVEPVVRHRRGFLDHMMSNDRQGDRLSDSSSSDSSIHEHFKRVIK